MPGLDTLIAFVATTAAFAFIPGPAMLYAAARTMAGGRRAGLMAVLGIHLGAYVHILAAAAGLTLLLQAVPLAYTLLKLAGALYLVWLGIGLIRARGWEAGDAPAARSPRAAFLESIAVEVLNPKTAIFFLAFLPQFVDPAAAFPVWLQFALLGAIVNALFTLADGVGVLLAEVLTARLRRSAGALRLVRRAGGTLLIGLGAHLALRRT
ncbi:LysE family translocator [Ensifer soli]|uniref:LysE family translocator n=1 Tax=Ciceribacter sp. sgz301302 TaxID=3342379 RepID=UPI0035B7349E